MRRMATGCLVVLSWAGGSLPQTPISSSHLYNWRKPFTLFTFICSLTWNFAATQLPRRSSHLNLTMIVRESPSTFNFGRGAYDTTGVPKPPPPKPR
ncbi:hypothetical protein B0T16DRAFT_94703 [Cercophora newfieldiana]|uniref:Secreted protein n=1 Tax=Cercophora newfieldiana TaxID=92897 RepID=A0AA39YGA2_9PEZI|nr:hypothetical protein B0T16DRAFT_94703 [Cercophora newfieldiana]